MYIVEILTSVMILRKFILKTTVRRSAFLRKLIHYI